MLHWWASLSLLKLQVLLRKESLQRGHVSSPRMFKSWERSSVQTTCAGVFSFVFGISLPVSSCLHLPRSSPSSPSLSLSSTYHQKEAKHSIWAIEFNVTKHSEEAAGGNLRVKQNALWDLWEKAAVSGHSILARRTFAEVPYWVHVLSCSCTRSISGFTEIYSFFL